MAEPNIFSVAEDLDILRAALEDTERMFGMKYPAAECALDRIRTTLVDALIEAAQHKYADALEQLKNL